jgi:3-oxoacyl-[acyl-carrier protein] reductase
VDLELRGKRAAVIGGSRGIGREIALLLADQGADVAVCARGLKDLEQVRDDLLARSVVVTAHQADAGIQGEVTTFLAKARKAFGSIDILVNNASGRRHDKAVSKTTEIGLDFSAAVEACDCVSPWMAARGGGAIINIASVAGLAAGWPADYSCTKAALISYTKGLAHRLGPRGIRVNAIAPGPVVFEGGSWDTVARANPDKYDRYVRAVPLGRLGSCADVANLVVFLASSKASWITGQCLVIDGGMYLANSI